MVLKDVAPAARCPLVPQVDIAAGNRIDVGHFSLLRFSPDGSADRLSKVGAPESITSHVMDFDFGDPGPDDTDLNRRTRPTHLFPLPGEGGLSRLLAMTNSAREGPSQIISDLQKFCLPSDPNQFTDSYCPVPIEGRWPTSSTRGGMRWTRQRARRTALTRTAKSCRSDAPMLASSLR